MSDFIILVLLHSMGIIHRDLRLVNILVTGDLNLKIAGIEIY